METVEHDELAVALAGDLASDLDRHFERLIVTYQRRVYGFALRLCGSPQDAEEIAQDAFVRAYRALASYPTERVQAMRLRPWLYQITLNVFRNRAHPQRPRVESLDAPTDGASLEIADDARVRPEALAEAAERRGELAARVTALPAHFRVAVVLRHVEGRTYREMAEILGEPVGTVKSHVHRGTLLLRASLAAATSGVR